MNEKINLSKKELIELLEPYDDDKLICFRVKLQQGRVGFFDITLEEDKSNEDYIILKSPALNEWYCEDIKELKNEERSREHCLNYTGEPKCHYTGGICGDDFVQICEDYRSDEGTYPCPYCNRTGLKPLNYGSVDNPEIVWECMRCGAELWYCETVEEMQQRCREINLKKNRELEERNNRQYERLSQLYDLIKKQDWETLTKIIQELEEAEEQLQKEWGTYGDVE